MVTKSRRKKTRQSSRKVAVRNALNEASDWIQVPESLQSVPGVPMDRKAVRFFAKQYPENSFWSTDLYRHSVAWSEKLKPRHSELAKNKFVGEIRRIKETIWDYEKLPVDEHQDTSPDLTREVRRKAHELGMTMLGITRFDRAWVNAESKSEAKFKTAIVGMLEQPWDITQDMPSITSFEGYYEIQLEISRQGIALADFIRSKGYPVQFAYVTFTGRNMAPALPYAVQAGLGQMGANGQLLTPIGSRCRFVMMTTDAPVKYDKPVDYGVNELCGKCLVCVRRCPGRALPKERVWWRGAYKYKTDAEKCLPMPAQFNGCGICMKVCPVQKYGLKEVVEHFGETGKVLGKGTDELEGYTLGSKGYWPAGRLPRFTVKEGSKGMIAMAKALRIDIDDLVTDNEQVLATYGQRRGDVSGTDNEGAETIDE